MNNVLFALLAGLMTYSFTVMGSALVLFLRKPGLKMLDIMLSLAAGVMLSSSYFSLLAPAIDSSKNIVFGITSVFIGFTLGSLLLFLTDKIFSKKTCKQKENNKVKRLFLLFAAITIHNIPEGLAVGVAFGEVGKSISLSSAFFLSLGIAIQNFPEGASISLPMKRDGISTKNAFFFGQISGIVEPISSIIGALLVIKIRFLLPFLLSFAAGAMIYVTISEIIPEAQKHNKSLSSLIIILGFTLMMFLDLL